MTQLADNPNDANNRPHLSLRTTQPTAFGHGWISGVLSVFLGGLGLGAVLCFYFPEWLTMPELRAKYPLRYVRGLMQLVLLASFLLGSVSVCLRYNKALGLVGISLTLIATLLGGSQVPVAAATGKAPPFGLSLDWFLLNLILYSIVYVPLERQFALRPEQSVFRKGWKTDLTYFFVNTLFIQVLSVMTLRPAMVLFDWARFDGVTAFISGLPFVVQVIAILLVADLTQYWVHRMFHQVPWLWRFHAIHHSAESMDWLAGSRLHLVDAVLTRGATYVPIYVLGFSEPAFFAYLGIVVVQATFIHANVRWEFPRLSRLLATPCFHHWHHSAEPEAIDKNFAVHMPIWDKLFGTYHMPGRWPAAYGLAHGRTVPPGWGGQFVYPLKSRRVVSAPQEPVEPLSAAVPGSIPLPAAGLRHDS